MNYKAYDMENIRCHRVVVSDEYYHATGNSCYIVRIDGVKMLATGDRDFANSYAKQFRLGKEQ